MSRLAQFRPSAPGWPGCGGGIAGPTGLRYGWTDTFGVVLLVSLYHELQDERHLAEAEWLVAEVERSGPAPGPAHRRSPGQGRPVLPLPGHVALCPGPAGAGKTGYRDRAIELVRQIHPAFVRPGAGVVWKMREDLSGPYPGYGLGLLDSFHGYVVYRLLAPEELAAEIRELQELVARELSVGRRGPGPGAGDDALVHALFSAGGLGRGATAALLGDPGEHVDRAARAIFAAIRACRR